MPYFWDFGFNLIKTLIFSSLLLENLYFFDKSDVFLDKLSLLLTLLQSKSILKLKGLWFFLLLPLLVLYEELLWLRLKSVVEL